MSRLDFSSLRSRSLGSWSFFGRLLYLFLFFFLLNFSLFLGDLLLNFLISFLLFLISFDHLLLHLLVFDRRLRLLRLGFPNGLSFFLHVLGPSLDFLLLCLGAGGVTL